MRIGEQDCDEICKGCEKENDPLWCLEAMFEMIKKISDSYKEND
jgi:hypothetical protein